MPPDGWEHVRRILAIRLDNIGDVVMLTPALRTLRAELPQAKLTLMASPAGSQVAPLLPWVDDVMVVRAVWQDASGTMPLDPDREHALIEDVHTRQFDAAVIFTSFSQSPYPPAYICYLAGVPIRIGQSKEFGGSILSLWVRSPPDHTHQVDRNLYLLECAGFTPSARHLELKVPDSVQIDADRHLHRAGVDPYQPFIVLAPGASCAARRYDLNRFAGTARLLTAQSGLPIVLVGSEREAALAGPILARCQGHQVVSVIGRTSVPQLAAIIRRSRLVIGNHSGSMHIADAFCRPMVILFSGTDLEEQFWHRPRGAVAAPLCTFSPAPPSDRLPPLLQLPMPLPDGVP